MGRFSNIVKKTLNVFKKEEPVPPTSETPLACTWTAKDDAETFTNDAKRHFSDYTGVPAPVITEPDPWFNEPVKTELQMTHKEMLEVAREREEAEKPPTKEPENIHEVMYNMATKNQSTTVQLDPPGGSENFQSGPGGWTSGNGQNQFR